MKRKAQTENNDEHTLGRRRLFAVEEERIEDLLHFSWVDSADSQVDLPSSETHETQETGARFHQAYNGCQTSFHESMVKTSLFLKSCGVKVCNSRFVEANIKPRSLNNTHIANLLNSFDKEIVLMHGGTNIEKKSVKFKGRLLLYAICQLYRCRAMLFSTRSKAILVHPANVQRNAPCFYILEHKDSYIQETKYYALKSTKKPLPTTRLQVKPQCDSKVVAIKRKPEEKKPKNERSKLGRSVDKTVVDTLKNEVQPLYDEKWRQFLDKNRNKPIDTSLISQFGKTLSKKQLPTGVTPVLKEKVEEKIRNKEIPNKSEKDIPKSKTWMSKKIEDLKKRNEINIEDLVQDFLEKLKSDTFCNLEDRPTSSNNNDQDGTDEKMMLDLAVAEERIEKDNPSYRTVGKTLKAVINQRFDYGTLHERFQTLQTTCSRSIYGLSKAVESLISIIFCGDISQGPTAITGETFELKDIDFGGHQIGKDEQCISQLGKEVLKSLEDENLFSFLGFYNILSACVGRIQLKKKDSIILNAIIDKMDPADTFPFTLTPALVSACKQYFTNFSNMWCHDFYKQDLRVVVTLLLRINLARKRFFSPKKNRYKKKSQEKVIARKQRKGFLKKRMDNLFEALVKHGTKKERSVSCVKQIIDTIINHENYIDFGTESMGVDTQRYIDEGTEKLCIATEYIVEETENISEDEDDDDFITSTDNIPIDQDLIERDLTSKEINALIAVIMMLSGAESIHGDINRDYVKKQLYKDKQETIPDSALLLCANMVNTLRRISLKRDQEATFLTCYKMRHLRNVLVRFAGNKTKFRERTLLPVIQENRILSVNIDPKTLYLLFCGDYTMYKDNGQPFTAYSQLDNDYAKASLYENFFSWDEINRILQEQKLKPAYSITYTNQYDVKFLGKRFQEVKKHPPIQDAAISATFDKENIQQEIQGLHEKIKSEKLKYAALTKQLNPQELQRMEIGKKFRKLKTWDFQLYSELKKQRKACNFIYEQMSKANTMIKNYGYKMYILNKKLHNQVTFSESSNRLVISDEMANDLVLDKTIIQGIDPGIVTTASINCLKPSTLFESVNRFNLLSTPNTYIKHEKDNIFSYAYTASMVNDIVFSTNHRFKREKKQKDGKELNLKDLQKKRITRKLRTNRFYKKHSSTYRRKILQSHSLSSRGSFLTFLGSWSGNAKYVRGHERRSLAPISNRMKSIEKDALFTINEHKSTITCNSCFSRNTKQLIRRDNRKIRIKGAVTCTNVKCPRRLSTRATTTNRDENGARNIALIGFCRVVSDDGLTLPPFRVGYNKPNKFNLSTHFQRTSLVTLRSSGVPDN